MIRRRRSRQRADRMRRLGSLIELDDDPRWRQSPSDPHCWQLVNWRHWPVAEIYRHLWDGHWYVARADGGWEDDCGPFDGWRAARDRALQIHVERNLPMGDEYRALVAGLAADKPRNEGEA